MGGGVDLVEGGVGSRGGYISKILYVKTKELGSLGGRAPGAPPLDPPMVTYPAATANSLPSCVLISRGKSE